MKKPKFLRKEQVLEIRHVNPQDAVNRKTFEKLRKLEEAVAGQEVLRQKGYIDQGRQIEALRNEWNELGQKLEDEFEAIYDILENGEIRSRWVFGGKP